MFNRVKSYSSLEFSSIWIDKISFYFFLQDMVTHGVNLEASWDGLITLHCSNSIRRCILHHLVIVRGNHSVGIQGEVL